MSWDESLKKHIKTEAVKRPGADAPRASLYQELFSFL